MFTDSASPSPGRSSASKVHVLVRDGLPSITSVDIDGQTHHLGLVKDLRRHPAFADVVPEASEVSISWVRLGPGEVLSEHVHPTTSVIIITEGTGEVRGDARGQLRAGDVVLVPPGALHGFEGGAPAGFWALSLQFEGRGLYSDPTRPRVAFHDDPRAGARAKLELLLRDQRSHMEAYANNPLVRLVQSDRVARGDVRRRLLAGLQRWSDVYQRVLFARAAGEAPREFQRLAEQHLAEEVGHNHQLARYASDGGPARWDPTLAAASSWFVERMTALAPAEQAVLVHFVLEGSGDVFHQVASDAFPDSQHFALHKAVEVDHVEMALAVLRAQPDLELPPLRSILEQGWAMINLVSERIAAIALAETA